MKTNGIQQIRNFYRIDKYIATAGQPTIDEFPVIKQNNIELIINLATGNSPGAIGNEADVVTGLGLEYIHIPVDFKAPTFSDLERFFKVMEQNHNRHVLVHCALNWRVSSFIFLYRIVKCNLPVAEAKQDLHAVWKPDNVWQSFIDKVLCQYKIK